MPFKKKKPDVGTFSLVIAAFAVAGVATAVVTGGAFSAAVLDGTSSWAEEGAMADVPAEAPVAPRSIEDARARVDSLAGEITSLIASARAGFNACTQDFEADLDRIQSMHDELVAAEQELQEAEQQSTDQTNGDVPGPGVPPDADAEQESDGGDDEVQEEEGGSPPEVSGCYDYQWGLQTNVHFLNYCSPNGACPPGQVEFEPENNTCLEGQNCVQTDKGTCGGGSCIWCVDAGVCGNAILEPGETCEDTSAMSTPDHPWNCPAGQACGIARGVCSCFPG